LPGVSNAGRAMLGVLPEPDFDVGFDIPDCYAGQGLLQEIVCRRPVSDITFPGSVGDPA
jgi:hypothetical protein